MTTLNDAGDLARLLKVIAQESRQRIVGALAERRSRANISPDDSAFLLRR